MSGTIDVLNVSHGHLRLTFDPKNPIETSQASAAVQDMLRRGYMIFVETEKGELHRVTEFDEATGDYIIGNFPAGAEAPLVGTQDLQQTDEAPTASQSAPPVPTTSAAPVKPKKGRGRRVAASGAKATAIARTSGG